MEFIQKDLSQLATEVAIKNELSPKHVLSSLELLGDGNTIPFVARYRKEQTGSMSDESLRLIEEDYRLLLDLESRKQTVFNTLNDLEIEDETLYLDVLKATTLKEVEDLYRPYKPKKRTRASIAKERGLQPLADMILERKNDHEIESLALELLDKELKEGVKPLESIEEAYLGASDILAEKASDDPSLRDILRKEYYGHGLIKSHNKKEEDSVYRLYYQYQEPLSKIASHRYLAINRGEAQGYLSVSIELEENLWLRQMIHYFFAYGKDSLAEKILNDCAVDAYKRLIAPSLENEIRNDLKQKAEDESMKLFSLNLKNALMVPPMSGYTILALDPGFRNGCKWAVVNPQGGYLDAGVIYPVEPFNKVEQSQRTLLNTIKKHGVNLCAIGNGTAGRETERFFANMNQEENLNIPFLMVDESGASIYSATKLAASELPNLEVNLRSAISLARRIQDPLAELVKIDPWSIGVGQYQHDMNQKRLSTTLGGVVEDVVNRIGVSLNTASSSLLSYVSGVNKSIAQNIVAYREANGAFKSRAELKKVPKLGPKAFEQCAGFLRIADGKEPFDNTSVHPESYKVAKLMIEKFNLKLGQKNQVNPDELVEFAKEYQSGIETLQDIVEAIEQPGRDIRDDFPSPKLSSDIMSMEDLHKGQQLTGVVRNVTAFGAFVDLGVQQDGLVHISQMADRFVKDPTEIVSVGQEVKVTVLEVDVDKKRISLSMKKN